jgi:hypothetical protein
MKVMFLVSFWFLIVFVLIIDYNDDIKIQKEL